MKCFLIISLLLQLAFLQAQNLELQVIGIEKFNMDLPKFVRDSNDLKNAIITVNQELQLLGYLGNYLKKIEKDNTTATLYFEAGRQYKWVNLSSNQLNDFEKNQIDLSGRLFLNRPFNQKQLARLFKRTISYYENNGYPFATVKLDSIDISNERSISAAISVTKNQFYKVDSILIKGQSRINRKYLLNYLDLEVGAPFQEEVLTNISNRFNEIPFLKEGQAHQIQYFEDGIKVLLYPEKKQASRFDGILGLLTDEQSGEIELTGDVDLNLINSFNRGEKIGFNWRKLKGNSQDLNLELGLPFIFNTPFGLAYNFKLFRRDTTFLELNNRIGLDYVLGSSESITFFYENKSSSLLSRDQFIDNPASLPNLGDVSINLFGLGYRMNTFNYLYNPTRGIGINSDFAVGTKRLQKIAALEEENPTVYENVDLSTTQYNGYLQFSWFVPIKRRSTILFRNQSSAIYSENVYQNELLRIGGLKLLRGFDEESITVSTYSITTLEYRFLLDRNSFFSLFTDYGYYEVNTIDTYFNDTPIGIGAGISFETKAGIFTFNYAVGRQQDNPFDLQIAKIHFGFINIF